MRRSIDMILALVLFALPALPASAAKQEGTSPTVAEAARRTQDHLKSVGKAPKVVTEDDLDPKQVKPGAQGLTVDAPPRLETQPPSPEAVATEKAADSATATGKDIPTRRPDASVTAAEEAEIASVKEQLAGAEKDVDLAKRELALEQDTYFSRPNYLDDHAGKTKLEGMQQSIDDKQGEVERLQAHLAALLEKHPPAPEKSTPSEP